MHLQNLGVALAARGPDTKPDNLIASFRPGRRFEHVRFSTFHPNLAFPSQARAHERLEAFVLGLADPGRALRGLRLRGR